jgi:hypothetical protein
MLTKTRACGILGDVDHIELRKTSISSAVESVPGHASALLGLNLRCISAALSARVHEQLSVRKRIGKRQEGIKLRNNCWDSPSLGHDKKDFWPEEKYMQETVQMKVAKIGYALGVRGKRQLGCLNQRLTVWVG